MGKPAINANIVAGLSVAGLVLPESIADGLITGLPPVYALAAALAGLSVYAIVERCQAAIATPFVKARLLAHPHEAIKPGWCSPDHVMSAP